MAWITHPPHGNWTSSSRLRPIWNWTRSLEISTDGFKLFDRLKIMLWVQISNIYFIFVQYEPSEIQYHRNCRHSLVNYAVTHLPGTKYRDGGQSPQRFRPVIKALHNEALRCSTRQCKPDLLGAISNDKWGGRISSSITWIKSK